MVVRYPRTGEDIWRFAWAKPPEDGSANLADASSALVTGRILNGYTDNVVVSAEVGKFPSNPEVYTIWVAMSLSG